LVTVEDRWIFRVLALTFLSLANLDRIGRRIIRPFLSFLKDAEEDIVKCLVLVTEQFSEQLVEEGLPAIIF
jgi:histone H3/H4